MRILALLLLMASTALAASPTQPVVRFPGDATKALFGNNTWRIPTASVTTSIYAGSGVSLEGGPTGNVTVSATGTVVGATAPLTISSSNVSLTYDPATISVTSTKLSLSQIVTGASQGSASSIPILTIDNYGRVTALSAATISTTDSLATTTYAGITRLSWPPDNPITPVAVSDNDPRLPRYIAATATANNQVFSYTGADQSWVVPSGVYTITVKAWGAGGAGGTAGTGGGGGYSSDILTVTPGTTVTVKVGRGGQINSGDGALYGEGGYSVQAGGGGGYAMVTNGTWEVYAGGGGGGGGNWGYGATAGGAGGGSSGVAGGSTPGGGPGTQSAVGAGGGGQSPGNPGVAHHGGNWSVFGNGVGAGGGGYYGGGTGGINDGVRGGGGGGSGHIITAFGTTTAGSGVTPGNATDPDRAGMGDGGGTDTVGDHGLVKISWAASYSLSFPSIIFLGPTAPTTNGQISFDGSALRGYDAGSTFPLRTTVTLTPSGGTYVNGVQTAQTGASFNVSSSTANDTDNVTVATNTSTESISTTEWTDLGSLSVTITPSSANNKILVHATICASTYTTHVRFRLLRGATPIGVGDAAGSRTQVSAAMSDMPSTQMTTISLCWLDSPATTSATTYKIQGWGVSGVTWLNRSSDDADSAASPRGASTIVAQEMRQ